MSSRRLRKPETDSTDEAACRRHALDLLARREHSRVELERKLGARGYAPDTIAAALDALTASGALAEARFTESFVRARAARGQGPVRIRLELAERGVQAAASDELLSAAAFDWHALARQVRAKRFGSALPKSYKDRARQAQFLRYRGFDAGQIDGALELHADSD